MNNQDPRPSRNRMFRLPAFDGNDDEEDDIIFVSRKSPSPRRSIRWTRSRSQRTLRMQRPGTPPVVAVVDLDNSTDNPNTLLAEFSNEPSTSTGITSSTVLPAERETIVEQEPWENVKNAMMRLIDEIDVVCPKVKAEQETLRITCPICFETPTSVMATMCGHIFCENCITQIVQKPKASCPTCRERITKKKIHPLYL